MKEPRGKLKLLSLFSGIGAIEEALKKLKVDTDLIGFSEIDKYAIKSYCAIHGVSETKNLGDITKIDIEKLPVDIDMITHGSPCQDFSVAGLQKGGDKGSGTRSSLMWNTVDIVKHCKPQYVIWENVKNLLSKKHRHNFDAYLETMENLGYKNYYKVLNAKNYGIPQNRERVFTISIRNDIDKEFIFPEPIELKLRLKDIMQKDVEEKYYMNKPFHLVERKNVAAELEIKSMRSIKEVQSIDGICPTLTTMQGGHREPKILINNTEVSLPCIVASRGRNPENPSDRTPGIHTKQRLEVNKIGLSNTLTTVQKDNYVIVREATKKGYAIAKEGDSINLEQPNSKTRRDRVGHGVAQTLTTSCNQSTLDNYRIRKLTPLECWRLMGFSDESFYKAAKECSNSQLYKQAGNSIVVNVLVEILKNLLF